LLVTLVRTISRSAACIGFAIAVSLSAATAAESLGPVVLTHAHGDATAIWDATSDLAAIITTKPTAEETFRRLEADALTVLADKGKTLSSDAKTLSVQVIYQRSGAVSPAYQTATFVGVERLLAVKADPVKAAENIAAWTKQLKAGTIPPGVTVSIGGKLPPELK
jgi:hypothetical protein